MAILLYCLNWKLKLGIGNCKPYEIETNDLFHPWIWGRLPNVYQTTGAIALSFKSD